MTFQDFFFKNNKNGVRTNEKFLIKNQVNLENRTFLDL